MCDKKNYAISFHCVIMVRHYVDFSKSEPCFMPLTISI